MKNLYFAHAIRVANDEYRIISEKIKSVLRDSSIINLLEVRSDVVNVINPGDILTWDIGQVLNADVLVAFIDNPSFGAGFEVATFFINFISNPNKRLVFLTFDDLEKSSAFIKDMKFLRDSKNFSIQIDVIQLDQSFDLSNIDYFLDAKDYCDETEKWNGVVSIS